MSRFTILLGGDLYSTPRLAAQIADTRVIAADSGIRHAAALGVVPELWVGDFDSAPDTLEKTLAGVERRSFPKEKDQTDGELAVKKALERGASSLVFAGAFGGQRFDHSFFHATLAVELAENGTPVLLTSGRQEATPLIRAGQRFDYDDGMTFSVIAFTNLEGLTVDGARWPLKNVNVPFGSSWTISNEVSGQLSARLAAGRAILLAHPYPDEGF
jgi:thiamine pyrophosphokinase